MNIKDLFLSLENKGQRLMIAIVGQAGAGKSTLVKQLQKIFPDWVERIPFDYWFKHSRQERQELIDREKRDNKIWFWRDQINWWDFQKAEEGLKMIKMGKVLELKNVYNREDNGERNLNVVLVPKKFTIVEGVPLLLLPKSLFDLVIYLHASEKRRKERLLNRDPRKDDKALERWIITQGFELKYLPSRLHCCDYFFENSKEVDDFQRILDIEEIKPISVVQSFVGQKISLRKILGNLKEHFFV